VFRENEEEEPHDAEKKTKIVYDFGLFNLTLMPRVQIKPKQIRSLCLGSWTTEAKPFSFN